MSDTDNVARRPENAPVQRDQAVLADVTTVMPGSSLAAPAWERPGHVAASAFSRCPSPTADDPLVRRRGRSCRHPRSLCPHPLPLSQKGEGSFLLSRRLARNSRISSRRRWPSWATAARWWTRRSTAAAWTSAAPATAEWASVAPSAVAGSASRPAAAPSLALWAAGNSR